MLNIKQVCREWNNVLINPACNDVERLEARKIRLWLYDSRLRGFGPILAGSVAP